MKTTVIIIAIVLFGFLLSSCGGTKKTVNKPGPDVDEIENFDVMKEEFNPLALNDDDIELDEAEEEKSEIDFLNPSTLTTHDSIGIGYRIQIIQTVDPEEAKDVMKDAILRFEDEVYRVFDPPYYKIRIGDFVSWSDAEKIHEFAIKKGFRDAWVIRTKINLKRAYREINDF